MSGYLFALLVLSLAISIASILAAQGPREGLSRHVRFLSSLLLLCLLVSPLCGVLQRLREWQDNGFALPDAEMGEEDYTDRVQSALDSQSHTYFVQLLTQMLEEQHQIEPGLVRCVITWNEAGSLPTHVTVLLSGSAIWKDPVPIRETVEGLLNCPCDIVIE